MHRKNFLYNAGILFPVIAAFPATIFEVPETSTVSVLVMHGLDKQDKFLAASVKDAFGEGVYELDCKQVKRLSYTGRGFSVTTVDNRRITTKKIILNTSYTINSPVNAVEIRTDNAGLDIDYNNLAATSAECWFFQPGNISAEKLLPFMRRKRNAFLCV